MTLSIGLLMFPALIICIFIGFPVAFSLMGVAVFFGLYRFEFNLVHQLVAKVDDVASYYVLAAVPLFIFMGSMLERSGIAEKLFEAIHLWTRRLPGGLAIGTVLLCVVLPPPAAWSARRSRSSAFWLSPSCSVTPTTRG